MRERSGASNHPSGPRPDGERSRLIGHQLRTQRHKAGLTLRSLGAQAGVTASLLSQIETGRVNPSVETLFALAEALSVPVTELLPGSSANGTSDAPAKAPLVREGKRSRVELENGVTWESLLPTEEHGLEFMVISYGPGATSASTARRHGGRDYGVVIDGSLTVELGFSVHVLNAGDSIAFDATTPHRLRNDTSRVAKAIWLVLDRNAV